MKEKVEPIKKSNSLFIYKLLVIIILLVVCALGVMKLADFLGKPRTLFYSVLNDSFSDANSLLTDLSSNNLYSIISKDNIEVNADTTVKVSGLENTDLAYQNDLNSLKYISTTKFSQEKNYFSHELSINRNTESKINVLYLDDNFKNYFNIRELFNNYISFDEGEFNIEQINASKTITLGNLIKDEFTNVLDDDKFVSNEEVVTVNNGSINCKVNTYSFTADEFTSLYNNILTKLASNDSMLDYLSKLYGVSKESMKDKIVGMLKTSTLNKDTDYVFSAYTKKNTDETVKLSLNYVEKDSTGNYNVIYSYSKNQGYKSFEYTKGNTQYYLNIEGNINGTSKINFKNSVYDIELTTNNESGKTSGNVKVSSDNQKSYSGTYSYNITASDDGYIGDLSLNLDITDSYNTIKLDINSSLKIQTNTDVVEADTANFEIVSNPSDEYMSNIEDNFKMLVKSLF